MLSTTLVCTLLGHMVEIFLCVGLGGGRGCKISNRWFQIKKTLTQNGRNIIYYVPIGQKGQRVVGAGIGN